MTPPRRVAVTGMGIVSPVGNDVASTWAALVAGQSGAGPITRFDSAKLPVHFACEVKGFDPLQYIEKKEARRYDLFSQFAMGAAVQAVRDACLEKSPLDPKRIGVIIGTGTGGIATFEENMRMYLEKGPDRVSPFFVPMFMANVASAIVSMRFGFQGPNYCTVSACASSGHALGDAFDLIREGKADVIVAGGSEAAITPLSIASFANMKALSTRNDDPKSASRPFDKDRDGFVMGDGAAWSYTGGPDDDRWIFNLQSDRPDNPQRMRIVITPTRDRIRFVEESSTNDGPWKTTEDYTYVRVK